LLYYKDCGVGTCKPMYFWFLEHDTLALKHLGIVHVMCAFSRMGEERGAYRVLVGKPEGRRPLGRPRRRWVDNISSGPSIKHKLFNFNARIAQGNVC